MTTNVNENVSNVHISNENVASSREVLVVNPLLFLPALQDWFIPSLYQRLIRLTNPSWPWAFNRNTSGSGGSGSSGNGASYRSSSNSSNSSSSSSSNSSGNEIRNSDVKQRTRLDSYGSKACIRHQKRIKNRTNADYTRVKIGFFSTFFFRHSVGKLLGSVIAKVDIACVDVIVFELATGTSRTAKKGGMHDDISALIRERADHWVVVPPQLGTGTDKRAVGAGAGAGTVRERARMAHIIYTIATC